MPVFAALTLPTDSVFRSGEPLALILLLYPLASFAALVYLQLAWRSIGIVIPVKRTVLPALILGLPLFLGRQLVQVPLNIFIALIALFLVVYFCGKTNFFRAAVGTIFTETISMVGTMLLGIPLMLIVGKEAFQTFLRTFAGFCVGTILESLAALIALFIFVKFEITLVSSLKDKNITEADNSL